VLDIAFHIWYQEDVLYQDIVLGVYSSFVLNALLEALHQNTYNLSLTVDEVASLLAVVISDLADQVLVLGLYSSFVSNALQSHHQIA
jgi:hypothetical protein